MKINCPCRKSISTHSSKSLFCPGCQTFQHSTCLSGCNKMKTYLCPGCQLIKSDFFIKIIKNVLPCSLVKYSSKTPYHHTYLFTPLFHNYPSKTGTRPNFLIIRCLKLTNEGFCLEWPEHCKIQVNDKTILTLNSTGSRLSKKKLKEPIFFWFKNVNLDIKDFYISAAKKIHIIKDYFMNDIPNRISVTITENQSESTYAISIDYVEIIYKLEDIINKVPRLSDGNDINLLIFRGDNLPIKMKMKLIDVYSEINKIIIPARGVNCAHLEVFDLNQFLIFQKKVGKYNCPICNKKTCLVYIDEKLMRIIEERYKLGKNYVYLNEKIEQCDDEESGDQEDTSSPTSVMGNDESDIDNDELMEDGTIQNNDSNTNDTNNDQSNQNQFEEHYDNRIGSTITYIQTQTSVITFKEKPNTEKNLVINNKYKQMLAKCNFVYFKEIQFLLEENK